MKTGNFNLNDYIEKLHEEAESKIDSGNGYAATSDKDGIILPGDAKKSFDWLKKEYQKGQTEVKVEVKGEGSSFKPGYDLQTDLKSVKDFKPGMFGDVKTNDGETSEPKSPKNKTKEIPAEKEEKTSEKVDVKSSEKSGNKNPKSQKMNIDLKKKKNAE